MSLKLAAFGSGLFDFRSDYTIIARDRMPTSPVCGYDRLKACQKRHAASLGIRQSPRGERLSEPTFGPSGRQLRLNC